MEKTTAAPFRNALDAMYGLAAVTIGLVEIFFASDKELFGRANFGLHGPGGYWAFQWVRDYSHGFIRRGMLGQSMRWIGLDNTSYFQITVIAWSVTFVVALMFTQSLWRLLQNTPENNRMLLAITILLSPVTFGMFLEITGDPLQVVLLGYMILLRMLDSPRRTRFEFTLCLFFGVVSVLIHEASVFFFAPAIAVSRLLLDVRHRYAPFLGYLAGAVPAVLVVVFATRHDSSTALLPPLHFHQRVAYMPANQYPSFSSLIATDQAANFHQGIRGVLKMIYRFAACLVIPAFLVYFVIRFRFTGSSRAMRTAAIAAAFPALCCMPLFFIAHDWGRFFSFQFVLFIVHLSGSKPLMNVVPGWFPSTVIGLALVAAGLTTTPQSLTYRVLGLSDSRPIFASTVLALAAAVILLRTDGASGMETKSD